VLHYKRTPEINVVMAPTEKLSTVRDFFEQWLPISSPLPSSAAQHPDFDSWKA
jgi:hypothetical protein